jgi:hypothetical protein
MDFQGVILAGVVAAVAALGIFGTLLPGPGEADNFGYLRSRIKWPLLILVLVLGGVIWERQSVIDQTCAAFRDAMDFEGAGQTSSTTLDFEKTVYLFAAHPSLRLATRVCKAS